MLELWTRAQYSVPRPCQANSKAVKKRKPIGKRTAVEKEKIRILVEQGENIPDTGAAANTVQQERSEHQVSLMIENPMARQDYLRQVRIKTARGTATLELSPYCSANPFLRIDTVDPLGEVQIETA